MSIVEDYDKRTLYPMLVKLYNHLLPIVDGGSSSVNLGANQDHRLDIFQMRNNSMETLKEIITKELLDFRRFHLDLKEIKNPFQWWEKHESRFPVVALLVRQILGIVSSQIEIGHIFFLVGILTNLKRCHLQSKNLEKLNFASQN